MNKLPLKERISYWAAKTWKKYGRAMGSYESGKTYCILGAACKARFGNSYLPAVGWKEIPLYTLMHLAKFNDNPKHTKAQVLAYARKLGI